VGLCGKSKEEVYAKERKSIAIVQERERRDM